jgi:hypothetical protein
MTSLPLSHSPLQFNPWLPSDSVKKNKEFFPVIYQKIGCFWYAAKQKLSRKSDDEMFQDILKDYQKYNEYFMNLDSTEKPSIFGISAGLLYCDILLKRKLQSLVRRGISGYFAEQIQSGVMTRKDLLSRSTEKELSRLCPLTFKPRTKEEMVEQVAQASLSLSDEAFSDQISFQVLLGSISDEQKIERLFSSLFKTTRAHLTVDMFRILALRIRMQQDQCLNAFLKLFPTEVISSKGGWKVCLAQLSANIDQNHIPAFIRKRFLKTYEGLPSDYSLKVQEWKKQQKPIVRNAELQLKHWSFLCLGTGDRKIGEAMERVLKERVLGDDSVEEFVDSQHYCVASKCAEKMHSLGVGEVDQFMTLQVEMNLVQDNWKNYRDRLSESEFKAAYDKWDKISLSVSEFEELLEKECAWKMWKKYCVGFPKEQFAKLFKHWHKENPKQNYEARCLEVYNARQIWNRLCSDRPEEQFALSYLNWLNSHSNEPYTICEK